MKRVLGRQGGPEEAGRSGERGQGPGRPAGPKRVVERTLLAFDGAVSRAALTRTSSHDLALEATKWFVPGDRDRRHDAILEVVTTWDARSLLEVGSGAGDFYARLRRRAPGVRAYTGVDLSSAMVEAAEVPPVKFQNRGFILRMVQVTRCLIVLHGLINPRWESSLQTRCLSNKLGNTCRSAGQH